MSLRESRQDRGPQPGSGRAPASVAACHWPPRGKASGTMGEAWGLGHLWPTVWLRQHKGCDGHTGRQQRPCLWDSSLVL